MGQKTHPNGFRLISTQHHLSDWYNTQNNYSILVAEDYLIRSTIMTELGTYLTIANIKLQRITNNTVNKEYILIELDALYPRIKDSFSQIVKYFNEIHYNFVNNNVINPLTLLQKKKTIDIKPQTYNFSKKDLKSYLNLLLIQKVRQVLRLLQKKTNKTFFININLIKNSFTNSNLIAKHIRKQLEQRISFKRIIKETIVNVQQSNPAIKGLKIQISGRLDGIDIARTEWKLDKQMPLQTLTANINYSWETAKTIYGLLGIKVWLYLT